MAERPQRLQCMLINMLSIEPAARRYGSDPPNQPWQGPGIWDGMIFPKIVITTVRKTVQIRIGDRSQPKVKLKFLNDQIENLTIKKG